MADFNQIAKEFVKYYYDTFDKNRGELKNLYGEGSMLTFQGENVQGIAAIDEKIKNLPFQGEVRHVYEEREIDVQPSADDGILVVVTGAVQEFGQERPFSYTQTFQLKSANGSIYVFNDIFRLVFPAS